MPLEPIDEKDLDLKGKFSEKAVSDGNLSIENEVPKVAQEVVERKEGGGEKDSSYSKILSKVKTTSVPTDHAEVKSDADLASEEADVNGRVERLVDLAMQKGVVHAVKVAQHLDDNYMLDELHDKLMADELHDALMQKGLIRDI